jgi:hypothetical protein
VSTIACASIRTRRDMGAACGAMRASMSRKRRACVRSCAPLLFGLLAQLLAAARVGAQPAATDLEPASSPAPDLEPTISTAAGTAAPQASARGHHGFSARAAFGFGAFSSNLSGVWAGDIGAPENDGSLALDLLVGGALNSRIVFGGALVLDTALIERGISAMGRNDNVTRRSGLFGPFIDCYPEQDSGLHVGGTAGLSALIFEPTGPAATLHTLGVGGALWGGEDFSIAGDWSLGPMVRLMGERTWETGVTSSVSAWGGSVTLMVAGLYR